MLTNNFIIAMQNALETNSSATYAEAVVVKHQDGTTWQVRRGFGTESARFMHMGTVLTSVGYNGNRGVVFGNGTGEVGSGDYNLFGSVIKNLAYTTVTRVERNGNTVTKQVIYTLTNGNAEDVTISECGYFEYAQYYNDSSYCMVMLDHTLLDSPVTIPAGGIGQVTYTITFNIA